MSTQVPQRTDSDEAPGGRAHLVRPRWVWAGLGIAIAGAVLIAWWIAVWWLPAGIAGGVLLLVGAGVGWRGGILYDTRGSHDPHGSPGVTRELADLVHGRVHEGTAPGDMVVDERLRAEARETNRRTEALLRASEAAPRPAFDTLAGGLMLGAAALLVVIQGMYPQTHTGQDNGLRSLILAVVIGLSALRILLAQRAGRAPSLLAGLCGLALILFATLTDHDRQATVVIEIIIGAWVVVMSLLSLDHAPAPQATRAAGTAGTAGEVESARALAPRHPTRRGDDVRIAAVSVAGAATIVGLFGLARRLFGRRRPPAHP